MKIRSQGQGTSLIPPEIIARLCLILNLMLSDNGEIEKSEVDAEVEQMVESLVDAGSTWLHRVTRDVSKSSVAKQVRGRPGGHGVAMGSVKCC
jgi:hypothetical protein